MCVQTAQGLFLTLDFLEEELICTNWQIIVKVNIKINIYKKKSGNCRSKQKLGALWALYLILN